jgi:cobalt/nickel transport system ATP-binding protein
MNDTLPAARLDRVAYRYPDGRLALEDLSVSIPPGVCTALIGPNGSGKSTLLPLLNGIRRPQAGAVTVLGLPVDEKHLGQVRRHVGLVFQDPDVQLFCPTVEEDIAFGLLNLGLPPDEVRRLTSETLAFVGLEGFERRSPFHLSGGERKLVSLATVLAMHPPVLALDEPTANLDAWHRRRVLDVLRRLNGTQVVATHDLDLALELAAHAVVLFEHRVVAEGPVGELLRDEALLRRYRLDLPLRLQGPPAIDHRP